MLRQPAMILAIGLTLFTGLNAGYAIVGQLAPVLFGEDLLGRLPSIRLNAASR